MTECDAFNLIDEFIRQSYTCPTQQSDSSLALTITTSHTSCSNFFSKSSSKSPETGVFNTDNSSSNRTSGSSSTYESALDDEFKRAEDLKVYNDENEDNINTQKRMEEIFINLNMSKTIVNEANDEDANVVASVELKDKSEENQFVAVETVAEMLDCSDMFAALYPQKPKRPYSYYVATNFHPLDLTQLVNDVTPKTPRTSTISTDTATKTPVTKRVRKNKQITKLEMTNKRLSTSLGDFQIITQEISNKNGNPKSRSSSQHGLDCTSGGCNALKSNENIANTTNLKKNSSSKSTNRINKFLRNIFKIDSSSKAKSVDDHDKHKAQDKDDQQQMISNDSEEETYAPNSNNFTLTRLFNSFRGSQFSVNTNISRMSKKNSRARQVNRNSSSNNSGTLSEAHSLKTLKTNDSSTASESSSKKELVVMDEQPSKQLPKIKVSSNTSPAVAKPTVKISDKKPEYSLSKTSTGYGSANSTSPVSASYTTALSEIEQMRIKFYKEVAHRLLQLAGENSELIKQNSKPVLNFITEQKCQQDTSFNLDNVPFIDDDIDSNYEFDQFPLINQINLSIKSTKEITNINKSILHIFNESLINQFSQNPTYESLDQVCVDSLLNLDISGWHKIAAIFDLVLQAFKLVDLEKHDAHEKREIMLKLKETASNYIHDKYCDWIYENGGWNSVPISICMKQPEYNERIH